MTRRKNTRKSSQADAAFVGLLISTLVALIIKIILVLFDFITIYSSGYKKKSGNGFFKTYFNKGHYGEFKLYKKAVRLFGKENVFTNIYLENVKTEYTEIDVVALSTKGIYVFEMKNYGGYIYGSQYDENWTQVFHKNSKNPFYNPIKQNYAHSKAIEKYLSVDMDKIIPVIVFANRAKLNKINVNEDKDIIQLKDLNKFVSKLNKKKQSVIDRVEIKGFAEKLINKSNMSDEVKQKHIVDINEIVNSK